MYSVTADFLSAMNQPIQQHRISGTIGSASFGPVNILAGSFSVNNKICDSGKIGIGNVYIGELTATFRGVAISDGAWQGQVITPVFSLLTDPDTDTWEDVPLGVFTVQEATISASGVSVKAYDNMAKFDKYCTTYHGAGGGAGMAEGASVVQGRVPYPVVVNICNKVGVSCGMTWASMAALPNGTNPLNLFEDNDITTYRDMLSWIAQTLCSNATINRNGELVFVPFKSASDYTFDDEHRHEGASFKDFTTRITEVWLDCKPMEMSYAYNVLPNNGLSYELGQNPFLQIGTSADRDAAMNEILTGLQNVNYTPFEVNLTGCPIFDLGDVLTFTDGILSSSKKGAVTSFTYTYNAAYKLSCGGQNPAEASAKSATDKRMDGINSSISSQKSTITAIRNADAVTLGNGVRVDVIDYPFEVTDTANHTNISTQIIMTTSAVETVVGDVFTIGDIVVKAILFIDGIEIGDLYPEFIVDEGKDTFTIDYSLKNLTTGAHNYKVALELYDATGTIAADDIHEMLWGYGITFEVYLKAIQVVSGKNRFFIGDLLDTSDWNVRGVNNNGTTISPLTGWTTDPADGTELDEEGTQDVYISYGDVTGTYEIEVIVPPTLTMKNIPLLKTDGFDSDFTSDIYYNPTSEYLMLSNIPDENTGQVLINKLSSDYEVEDYNYIPFHATAGPQAFVTDAGSSDATMMGMFTHPYLYNGSWRRDQYTLYDTTTDSVRVSEASHNVGNWIYRTDFTLVGIVPNDIAVNSDKVMLVALTETKVITKSGTTYYIPFFWYWPNTSLQFYNYFWGVQGQSGMFYSGFAFDHQDNDRLYTIKQNGTTLSVIEADYSELDNDVDNARSYDFLTAIQTFQTLTGNYNISLHERIYAANGLVAWAIIDEDNTTNTLYVANATTGTVQAVASIADNSLALGGFDYCSDLGMWFVMFGNKGYASTDGSTWTEVKLKRDGGGAITLHGNNFVLKDTMIYISNAGLYGGDLADIDI